MASTFETEFNNYAMPAIEDFFGVDVVVSSGSQTTSTFTARRNVRTHENLGADLGLEIPVTVRDYLLPIASVVFGSTEVEPKTGWTVTEGSEVYEISPPDENTPSVEKPAGEYDWLVHTKRQQT